jgi:hypothetical protein
LKLLLETGGCVRWRELYNACVSETKLEKLEKLVFETEEAIVLRCHELCREPYLSSEVQALRQAAKGLLEIKTTKLGWPDPARVRRGLLGRTMRRAMNRVRSILFVAERLWVKWVFKPSKRPKS